MAHELDRFHLLYAGSVKNVRSHPDHTDESAFEFTDDYSVFDWGKMPDQFPGKGRALLELAIHFFEKLENPNAWRIFFDSPAGKAFEEEIAKRPELKALAQKERMSLAGSGLRTHYRGFVPAENDAHTPVALRVENLNAVRPELKKVFGENTPDYGVGKRNVAGSLVPLEVIFRFELTKASSLLKRRPDSGFHAGQKFIFPYLECFTKLEDSDRFLNMSEALFVGRISSEILEDLLLKTAFVASFLRFEFGTRGLDLLDGKVEWGLGANGKLILADAIGPDELRLTLDGVSLSKEKIREYYRQTEWYQDCEVKKKLVGETGDWKSLVKNDPERLPKETLDAIREMYLALANTVVDREIFQVPSLKDVTEKLKK